MALILDVKDLCVAFNIRPPTSARARRVRVVDGVSFSIEQGETVAIVGESGSGKSTAARGALRLLPIDGGTVELQGTDITSLSERHLRPLRRHAQMVFQDPYSSLDPSMTAANLVAEAREKLGDSRRARHDIALEMLNKVGLTSHHADRYPYEFSGGQRQRIAIARALAPEPGLVVCDEAVSALDLSTQNQIISLLCDLRDQLGVAYLFISHDLGVVRRIADRVAVMYCGQVVEEGPTRRVFDHPTHPFTLALLSAIPVAAPRRAGRKQRMLLTGDLPNPADPPAGCRFHTRCPFVMDLCRSVIPTPTTAVGGGTVSCHLHTEGPTLQGTSVSVLLASTPQGALPAVPAPVAAHR